MRAVRGVQIWSEDSIRISFCGGFVHKSLFSQFGIMIQETPIRANEGKKNMKMKRLVGVLLCAVVLTACTDIESSAELSDEEKEHNAVKSWFEEDIFDEDEFTDILDYQYYARTIGLEKDRLLSPDMWEVYYSDSININKEIDGTSIYLIRLDPDKLIEVWAGNNDMAVDEVCSALGTNRDDLYYNFGYTANSIDYTKNHKDNKVSYLADEEKIFGADNGENRQVIFSTHFLKVDVSGKFTVTYESEDEVLEIRQRDLLRSTTNTKTYNISEFTEEELSPAFWVNNVGVRRVLLLPLPNGRADAGKKKACNFSLGMRQRLGIAMAMISEPDVLFLDEPVNGLDPIGIIQIRDLIKNMNKVFGTTIVISSHILSELYQVATKYIFIDNGNIIDQFSKEQLDDDCKSYIEIEINDVEKSLNILQSKLGCKDVRTDNEKKIIRVYDELADTSQLAYHLVNNGISLYKLNKTSLTLEESFISKVNS